MEDSLVAALAWIEGALLGSVALAVTTLSVAAVGFAMLQGRVPARRGARVVVGCFVLLSARALTAAFVAATPIAASPSNAAGATQDAAYRPTVPPPEDKDPYAGAAVPPPPAEPL